MSCSAVWAAAVETVATRSAAVKTAADASRRKPRVKPFKRSCSGGGFGREGCGRRMRSVLRRGLGLLERLLLAIAAAEDLDLERVRLLRGRLDDRRGRGRTRRRPARL